MDQIEVLLEICTTLYGVPVGLALINYKNLSDKYKSFKGMGIFNEGKLHNGSFTCINGFGRGYLYSKMLHGRPADNSYVTYFYKPGEKQPVNSIDVRVDVSGWQYFSGQIDKENRNNGKGKIWSGDGSVFIGEYNDNFRTEGSKYELQPDGTHTLYQVKCDVNSKEVKKEVSKGHHI